MENQSEAPLESVSTPLARERRSLLKELLPLATLSVSVLVLMVFVFFYKGFGSFFSDDSKKPELIAILQKARTYLTKDQLTRPAGANALEVYQEALRFYPESSTAKAGIKEVGERYLDLIRDLIADGDYVLAAKTHESAQKAAAAIGSQDLNDRLSQLKEQIDALEARASQTKTSDPVQALSTFQDALAIGGLGPKMVALPAGKFMFGSPVDEIGRDSDEGPRIEVTIQPFAMAITEVSFDEYKKYVEAIDGELPDDNGWGRGDRPVINVSWRDARKYAQWLSQQTGYVYRLPTEAEWEYAARAGTDSRYAFGDCMTAEQANFDSRDGSTLAGCNSGEFRAKTVGVTELEANGWGLLHVHGNVREWLKDCWEMSYYEHPTNGEANYIGEGGSCGDEGKRITRGGAWSAGIASSRIANRFAQEEYRIFNSIGIRLVREL